MAETEVKSINGRKLSDDNVRQQLNNYKNEVNAQFNTIATEKANQIDLNTTNGEINNLKNSKTDKGTTDNIQTQVNNLVLGAVGDGNNAEVVQSRGNFPLLNDRLNVVDDIRKSNLSSLINNEMASCFNYNNNLWTHGDVNVSYTNGQAWRFVDYTVTGLEAGEKYTISLTTALNHVNTDYIIEIVGTGRIVSKVNTLTSFTAPSTSITVRFQTIVGVVSTSENIAIYSGISIRKGSISIKDTAINKKYDIAEILRSDELYNCPIFLAQNVDITHTGGTNAYSNKAITYTVSPDTKYTVSYKSLTGNKLTTGNPTIVVVYKDSNDTQIGANTNLLFVDGVKSVVITTPINCTTLTLNFMVSFATPFETSFTVTWSGFSLFMGENSSVELKETALPSSVRNALIQTFEVLLPPHIYVAIGYPLEIYNHTICRCGNINNYHFVWSIPKGARAYKEKILLTPTEDMNNTTNTLTLSVYDSNFSLIQTVTSTVHYIKPNSAIVPSDVKKVLPIGDSLTDISKWRNELYTRFSNDIASDKIQFLGTLGTAPYLHEGHSGWSLSSFLENSGEGWNGDYKIKVAVAPTIASKKQYKFGTKIFEYEKTAIEDDVIWVYFNRISGSGFVTLSDSPCTQVDGAIEGDSSIVFTDIKVTSMNPFYNSATSGFDSKYYSDTYLSGVAPTDVIIWLGTNGGTPNISLSSVNSSVSVQIAKYKTIIDDIKANWTTTKIFVCYLHYRPNQDGQGNTNGVVSAKAWDNYIFEFNKQLFATFESYPNVIFVPIGQTFDRENNYPMQDININTRNTKTITVASNVVHMSQTTGFLQVADAIYGAYVNNLN